jgi:hypothetical protein
LARARAAAQRCPGGKLGVDRVALAQALVGVRMRLVDFEHSDPLCEQRPHQPGRVGAGRLDADPLDLAVAAQPRDQARVARGRGREGGRGERPSLRVEDADVVLVGVRVDTGDDALRVIGHPVYTVPSLFGGRQGRDGRTQQ